MSKYYNVTGSTGVAVELIAPNAANNIKSILLTNVHATADATVTLFIQDDPESGTTSTYNFLSTVAIPSDTALFLDNPSMFKFDEFYGLYIIVGSSDTVDVIINT
tara:strand:+ start:1524 stop:1838 length:315 start_codon:yes stop_codon:yes gene_type:complete